MRDNWDALNTYRRPENSFIKEELKRVCREENVGEEEILEDGVWEEPEHQQLTKDRIAWGDVFNLN